MTFPIRERPVELTALSLQLELEHEHLRRVTVVHHPLAPQPGGGPNQCMHHPADKTSF